MPQKSSSTFSEAAEDEVIAGLARKYWSSSEASDETSLNIDLVNEVYHKHIRGSHFNPKRILALEISQYLERYLWPKYSAETRTPTYVLSIVTMVNQKYRERVSAWDTFKDRPDHFADLFRSVTNFMQNERHNLNWNERTGLVVFLHHAMNSIEIDLIREQVQKYVSLPIWVCLSEKRREDEFRQLPKLQKFWKSLQKKDSALNEIQLRQVNFERRFLFNLINDFLSVIQLVPLPDDYPRLDKKNQAIVRYCERFLELLIGLESLLPTRRFFNVLLDDMRVIVNCRKSNVSRRHDEGKLFNQLLDMLIFYARFEIDDQAGEALTDQEMTARHYNKITQLQKMAWKNFPEKLKKFCLGNVANVDTRQPLLKHFGELSDDELRKICALVGITYPDSGDKLDRDLVLEMMVFTYEKVNSQLQALNEMPLYPTEMIIWDENIVPSEYASNESCLALPKLNLQFLTLHDYLLRNFHLFRLESTYEIRQDIEDAVFRMKPWRTEDGKSMFGGWARMALSISEFQIVEVKKPNIGESHPSRVRAEIKVNLNVRSEIKREWEGLRKHDVCFLVTVRPVCKPGTAFKYKEPFLPQVGLHYVRGCEVEGLLDASGKIVEEGSKERPQFHTDYRTYRVWLDTNQFALDQISARNGNEDVYETFNILIRRKPKENNFKAVLETIRDLMNTRFVVPVWLHDVILGYGDPSAAHYTNLNPSKTLDFNDTFLDFSHVVEAFPGKEVQSKVESNNTLPPFKLHFNNDVVEVEPYGIPNRGPYPFEQPKMNSVRFTSTQVEAIRSGMNTGLTLVVGPPGTGKTDVAVQIITNIYHNFPEQRTLIVTHSNQALNQIFEKIMALDVDERHMLRMGHGEEELETEKDFSRYGRVNYVLAKRLELLGRVQKLAESLNIGVDVAHTCETAGYFFLYYIFSRWEEFTSKLGDKIVSDVAKFFPFSKFFEDAPQPLFKGNSFEEDFELAKGCYRHIKKIFTQLDHFKAFEMLRAGSDRSRYLLIKEAKIIAMTCTHAALKRKELVELGFTYDNILMEEAAQILEIETFIPLLLQNPEHGHNRLKRWIMIGDHNQLPPVIKNMAFQKYGNMEQSLFTRLVRLGVPTVDLDAQGRCKPALSSLFRWRYNNLVDLPHVVSQPEHKKANAGFMHDFQLIDVQSFNGTGESEPVPYFYQNLGEAEYVVATFMYMRLLGYPADKITMLTTYNGQKHLLRDVVEQRCASNPFIGRPHKIATVDKFQGQQNDYILLSLVRTKTVGHLRDVRRLVVALSRARLGLYVFARVSNFANCYELSHAFALLTNRPQKLELLTNESYPTNRLSDAKPDTHPKILNEMSEMVQFVYEFYTQKMEQWQKEKPEIFDQFKEPEEPESEAVDAEPMETTNEIQPDPMDESAEESVGFEKLTEDDTGAFDREVEPLTEGDLQS